MDKSAIAMKIENNEKLISEFQAQKNILSDWRIRGVASACTETSLIVALGLFALKAPVTFSYLVPIAVAFIGTTAIMPITTILKVFKNRREIFNLDKKISNLIEENKSLKAQLSAEEIKTSQETRTIKQVNLTSNKSKNDVQEVIK